MKKLKKLSINQDKILKNEELVNLRGGDSGYYASCSCYISYTGSGGTANLTGICGAYTCDDCGPALQAVYTYFGYTYVDAACEDASGTIEGWMISPEVWGF